MTIRDPYQDFVGGRRLAPDFTWQRVPGEFETFRRDMNEAVQRGVDPAIPSSDYTILPSEIMAPMGTQVRLQGGPWLQPNYRPADTLRAVEPTYQDRLADQYRGLFGALGGSNWKANQLAHRMTDNTLVKAGSDFIERPRQGFEQAIAPRTIANYRSGTLRPTDPIYDMAELGLFALGAPKVWSAVGKPMMTEGKKLLAKYAKGAVATGALSAIGSTAPTEAEGVVPPLIRQLSKAAKAGPPRGNAILREAHIRDKYSPRSYAQERALQQYRGEQHEAIDEIRKLRLPKNIQEHAIDTVHDGVSGPQFVAELKEYLRDVAMGREELVW